MHRGKTPNRILQQHIVLGGDHDESGGIARDLDDGMINYNDPMEFTGTAQMFEGQSSEEVQAANLAQAAGLCSGYMEPRSVIDMAQMSSNDPTQPDNQGSTVDYGESGLSRWRKGNGQ